VLHKCGYKPWDIEKLYDYSIDITSSVLESYWASYRDSLISEAYYSFSIAKAIKENKGFKFDDFTDLLGPNFMDDVKEFELDSVLEARNRAYNKWQKQQKHS
jgi:hypothetical protein